MSRTVLRASFRSRAIALIFRFCTKYARRTLAIVSTVTIPLLTSGANHALGAGLPPGGGVKIGCRSTPERGQNCTPLHRSVLYYTARSSRACNGRPAIRLKLQGFIHVLRYHNRKVACSSHV